MIEQAQGGLITGLNFIHLGTEEESLCNIGRSDESKYRFAEVLVKADSSVELGNGN